MAILSLSSFGGISWVPLRSQNKTRRRGQIHRRRWSDFTDDLGAFRPREHNMLSVDIAETVFEPRVDGLVFDRGVGGRQARHPRDHYLNGTPGMDDPGQVGCRWRGRRLGLSETDEGARGCLSMMV
jgi:hypothetical protein